MGRPTDCTEAVIKRVERAARVGVIMRNLHKHAGVDQTTFWRWMSPDSEGINAEFRQRILAARAEREMECAEAAADNGSKTGHAWMLERSFGYHAHQDPDGAPATQQDHASAVDALAKLHPDLLREALRRQGG